MNSSTELCSIDGLELFHRVVNPSCYWQNSPARPVVGALIVVVLLSGVNGTLQRLLGRVGAILKDVEQYHLRHIFSGIQTPRPPCEDVLDEAERYNNAVGHENRGALSREYGFLPAIDRRAQRLPPHFQPWETLADSMDLLLHTQTLRVAVDALPLLQADELFLPDEHLQRAATVLALVAYSYVNMHIQTKEQKQNDARTSAVPEVLSIPWDQVCRRLGRKVSFMTYADGVACNMVLQDRSQSVSKTSIDNIEFVVHTQRTQQNKCFVGTMYEAAALAQPLLSDIVISHRAVLAGDSSALTNALESIKKTLLHVRHVTIPKLSPNAKSKTYVDPIAWVKSVANLGVHWDAIRHIPGPSGTGHPLFHLMDVYVGRKSYEGIMGHEAQVTRDNLPAHWQELFVAVGRVSVADSVSKSDDVRLKDVWREVCDLYISQNGILGFHKRKVFGYLLLAFRLGRSSTINGFTGNTRQEPWNKAVDALEEARKARISTPEKHDMSSAQDSSLAIPDKALPVSELLKHTDAHSGYWIAAQGTVYDITSYMRHHPGGHHLLLVCSGRDVSKDLETAHHLDDAKILTLMARYAVGRLAVKQISSSAVQHVLDLSVALGYQVNDLAMTFQVHQTFLDTKLTGFDVEGSLSPFKVNIYHDMEEHLRLEVVAGISVYISAFLKAYGNTLPDVEVGGRMTRLTEILTRIRARMEVPPASISTININELRRLIQANTDYFKQMQTKLVEMVELLESVPATSQSLSPHMLDQIEESVTYILDLVGSLGRAR